MTIENTDYYVVERNDTLNIVESQSAMTKILDDDLLVIGRGSSPYKITGAEFKQSVGPGPLVPSPDDVSASPAFEGGTGTELDPFIITPVTAAPAGVSVLSAQTITIDGVEGQVGTWTSDNTRFDQPSSVIGSDGTWSGQLVYNDSPETISDTVYTGYPKIGSVCFKWVVTQNVLATSPPTVDSVSLIESNPIADPRFTDQTFVASSQVTEGEPLSTKTIDAHVDGTLTKQVQFDELLESSGDVSIDYSSGLTQTGGATDLPAVFDGVFQTKAEMPIGSTIVWDCESFNLPAAEWYLQMFAQNNSGINVQVSVACEFRDLPDVSYTLNTNTNGSILVYFTGDVYNGGAWDQISSPTKVTVTYLAGPSGAGDFGLQYVLQNNEVLQDTSAIQLVFPTNADMEGLAAGDTVTQTTAFSEPLESSSVDTVTNTTALSQTAQFVTFPENIYSGDEGTWAQVSTQSSGKLFDIGSDGGFTIPEDRIFEINLQSTGQADMIQFQFNDENGDVIGSWVPFSMPLGAGGYYDIIIPDGADKLGSVIIHTAVNNGTFVYAIKIDGKLLVEFNTLESSTDLTFAAETDMSVLAPGDVVFQWSTDIQTGTLNAYNKFTIQNPESNCWDGNLNTYAEVNNTDGLTANTLDWYPAGGSVKEGDLVQIRSDSTGSFNCSPQQTFTPITSPFVGYEATIVDGELTFVRTSRPYGTSNQFNAIFVNGEQLIERPRATVSSITGTTAFITNSTGVWKDGRDVSTYNKEVEGIVGSITDKTVNLSSSTGSWVEDNTVVGPLKTITEENTRLYCAFDSNGNVTDLQNNPQDPPYTTTDSNPGLTFTFPATFPSGQTPDEELPDGTTFTVEVSATNTEGTSGPVSATVQPEPGIPPEPVRPAYLTGLTTLYDGNGTSQSITTGVDLVDNDGLVWIKNRSSSYHVLNDTVRGADLVLYSNDTLAEITSDQALTSFTDTGFTVGNGSDVNAGQNQYEAFTFQKAPGFFDVVEYTGTGSPQSIPHNLGTLPGMIVVKRLDNTGNWFVQHIGYGGADNYLYLNYNYGGSVNSTVWDGQPTDTEFRVGEYVEVNAENGRFIAYLFAADTSNVIKCGFFTGVPKITTGFRPQWVLMKGTGTNDWYIFNDKLPAEQQLNGEFGKTVKANSSGAEEDTGYMNFFDDGFQQQLYGGSTMYVAIAAPPPIPVPPGTLEGLTTLYTGNTSVQKVTNGLDLVNNDGLAWIKSRSGSAWHELYDTKRGPGNIMSSNANNASASQANSLTSFDTDGFTLGDWSGVNISPETYAAWAFQKAPGYFDVVKYESDGVNGKQIPHSLGTKPGMIIIKSLETTHDWIVYHKDVYTNTTGANYVLSLSSTDSKQDRGVAYFPEVTDTYFKVATSSFTNSNAVGQGYIAYLFADDNRGVIKCGSYEGSGASQTINTGFKPQWLLWKRTDQDGANWYIEDKNRPGYLCPNLFAAETGTARLTEFTSIGFTTLNNGFDVNASGGTYIYVAIAEPPAARSQTLLELADTKLKFATFENRSMVQCGNEAEAKRDNLIIELRDQGYLLSDILEHL